MIINQSWDDFKTNIANRGLLVQWYVENNNYKVLAFDQGLIFTTELYINEVSSGDQLDFESNYKDDGNKKLEAKKDKDGATVTNPKLATEGRGYQSMFATSVVGKFDGVVSKDVNNLDKTMFVQTIYDDQGDEITSDTNEGDSVLTTLEFKPTVSYDIQGFCLYQSTQPTTDIYLNAIAAHKIPAQYGGSKVSIEGYNLRHGPYGNREVDWVGDSTTAIVYDPVNFSHEHILKIYHPTGTAHTILLEVIWYV